MYIASSPMLLILFSYIPPFLNPLTPPLLQEQHLKEPPLDHLLVFETFFGNHHTLYDQLVTFCQHFPLSYNHVHIFNPNTLFKPTPSTSHHQGQSHPLFQYISNFTSLPLVHSDYISSDQLHSQIMAHIKHLLNFFPSHHPHVIIRLQNQLVGHLFNDYSNHQLIMNRSTNQNPSTPPGFNDGYINAIGEFQPYQHNTGHDAVHNQDQTRQFNSTMIDDDHYQINSVYGGHSTTTTIRLMLQQHEEEQQNVSQLQLHHHNNSHTITNNTQLVDCEDMLSQKSLPRSVFGE